MYLYLSGPVPVPVADGVGCLPPLFQGNGDDTDRSWGEAMVGVILV
jgi:hypothetical protein